MARSPSHKVAGAAKHKALAPDPQLAPSATVNTTAGKPSPAANIPGQIAGHLASGTKKARGDRARKGR
jgi:hypothetical protein